MSVPSPVATLLPPNATRLERAAEAATALDRRLADVGVLRRAKLDAAAAFVPWLIWEYGLGEVLPYLDEPRRAIREGVLWQRLRGTPRGLQVALSWRGLAAVTVEEEEPGVHFAEFQVDPGEVPAPQAVLDLLGLARLAAPVRSRLARVFHGYDVRRFRLDRTRFGEGLLSDHSGIVGPDGVRLSFGRSLAGSAAADAMVAAAASPVYGGGATLWDRFILDLSLLDDERPLPNPTLVHQHLHAQGNADPVAEPAGVLPERRFSKAMIVLSHGPALGGVNACFPASRLEPVGEPLRLSGAQRLSAYRTGVRRVPVFERIARDTAAGSVAI